MRVLVAGAYGLIGSVCLARLHACGHDVVGVGRSIAAARHALPYAQWIEADFIRLSDAVAWQPWLNGIDAVVNCVGVLQDGMRDNVERVQLAGTKALFDGCVRAGIKCVVHISAVGVDPAGPSAFSRTKAEAECYLRTLPLEWVILRPALVLAPAVYGGTAMLRGIAAFPAMVPVVGGAARIQVVGVDEVAETVAQALAADAPSRVVWDLAHPQVHSLVDIVTKVRAWLGIAPRPVVHIPPPIGRIIAGAADALGWLGWRSPARTTSFAQLTAGVIGDPAAWMAATGIQPKSLDQILAMRPASVQDRWFARLYLLKPLAIAGLAVALIWPHFDALQTFWRSRPDLYGVSFPNMAEYVLPAVFVSAINFAGGFAILFRPAARTALIVLIAVALLQIADHILRPWIYFYGPSQEFLFKIPLLLAFLFTLAIMDDR